MKSLKNYEKKVFRLLLSKVFTLDQLNDILKDSTFVSYRYTGAGYFLEITHPYCPEQRIVCSEPVIIGEAGSITSGFVIFLENKILTLECHSWGGINIPEDFRDKNVQIKQGI